MTIAAKQCRIYIKTKYPGVRIGRKDCRLTAKGNITQHSAYGGDETYDSNALDIYGPAALDYDDERAFVDLIVQDLAKRLVAWSIRKILWNVQDHFGHAHVDFYPMIAWPTKWCGGPETPSWTLSDGDIVKTRDPEPENGRYEGAQMTTHFEIGARHAAYEEVSWLLFLLGGGTVNPNANSSQVEAVLGKTDVRLVTAADFALIAKHTDMTDATHRGLVDDGLYRWGKEIAALRESAYKEAPA